MTEKENRVFIIETLSEGEWMPTVGVGLTEERAKAKMQEWQKDLKDRKFRIMPYKQWRDGLVFMTAIVMIFLGFNGWAAKVNQSMPGYNYKNQLYLTGDGPQGYDSWQNQLERKKERGK